MWDKLEPYLYVNDSLSKLTMSVSVRTMDTFSLADETVVLWYYLLFKQRLTRENDNSRMYKSIWM